jgi:hypothetical protein
MASARLGSGAAAPSAGTVAALAAGTQSAY